MLMSEPSGENKKPKRFRRVKRVLLVTLGFAVIMLILGWIFLPRIAERVIRGMIADAGLSQSELKVVEVGWNSAVIEDVKVQDDAWSVIATRIHVSYNPSDLANGRIKDIEIEGLQAVVNMEPEDGAESELEKPASVSVEENPFAWLHELPMQMEKVESISAQDARLVLTRGGRKIEQELTLDFSESSFGKLSASVQFPDYKLDLGLANSADVSEITVLASEVKPLPFLEVLEFLVDAGEPFLPEGFTLNDAELVANIKVEGSELMPLQVTGTLNHVAYDGGEKPITMKSNPVTMKLAMDFDTGGWINFAGAANELALPLDPSADFELGLKQGNRPRWSVRIAWSDDPTTMSGNISRLDLTGKYDGRPVSLDTMNAQFAMVDDRLSADGSFANGGTAIPFSYRQTLTEQSDARWKMDGKLGLGPVKHTQPLPLLAAVTDIFEDVRIEGSSDTAMEFSVGSHDPFRGKMTTKLSDSGIDVADGMLKASGVNGIWELHLLPLPDASPDTEDPSYYTLDFSAKKLEVASKDALDYDLVHEAEKPVTVTGKGKFGMEASTLTGEVKNLNLFGEKDGHEILLADTSARYRMVGDVVHADGKTSIGENEIPFTYWHDRKTKDDNWDLTGWFKIDSVDLKTPVENGVMLVDAMEGQTIAGKVSMKMDFTIGSEEDFDGVLIASLTDGTLTMEDDGPVLEGLRGDIRMSSLKEKKTDGFHRVTAKTIKAFDMEMSNLRLDYKMLPNGDIPLRNIAVSALGGVVWVDPFTLPGGDDNYQFKLRMKKLDLAKLAKLFPDFNGSVTGKIDGLLPIQNIGGEFMPVRGGMYLTPRSRGRLRYDAGNAFTAGLNRKSEKYKKMKMVEDSLRNLDLQVLSIRLFDPRDGDKALVMRLRGQAPSVPGSPPIILNVNGFKPDDDTVDFFDLLLKHRDKLNFGL